MKKAKYTSLFGIKIRDKIKKILRFVGLDGRREPGNFRGRPRVAIIIESIQKVNIGLEKGRYFYTDIKKEGIMLYNSDEFELSNAKALNFDEWYEMAQDDYNDWFNDGCEFLINYQSCFDRANYKLAAFMLHQATECFYNTILLVLSGYKPKLHNLDELQIFANNYDNELLKIFPLSHSEQKICYELLRDAYVKARYDKNYKIEKEQLLYLIERVEKLRDITERICLQKLNNRENETKLL